MKNFNGCGQTGCGFGLQVKATGLQCYTYDNYVASQPEVVNNLFYVDNVYTQEHELYT